jgi:hypothetical protein
MARWPVDPRRRQTRTRRTSPPLRAEKEQSVATRSRCSSLPEVLVCDRQAGIHAHDGRPTEAFAGFCGELGADWLFCALADPQAKGVVQRLQGYLETNFELGRQFANELDYQLQLDAWFEKVNVRIHRSLRCRPSDRLAEERELMAPLPATAPDTDRRLVCRVAPDPTCASTLATTRSTRAWSAAGSRSGPRSARSQLSRSTRASSPAVTGARSPSTARSLSSSTPAP